MFSFLNCSYLTVSRFSIYTRRLTHKSDLSLLMLVLSFDRDIGKAELYDVRVFTACRTKNKIKFIILLVLSYLLIYIY